MRKTMTALIITLAGCYADSDVAYTTTVSSEPPVPYDEVVDEAPGVAYVWVPGYWWWDGWTYLWVRGRWALPPADGYVWVRSGWVVRDGRYVFMHGRWARRGHAASYRYVHPSPRVRVRSGAGYRTSRRR